jgi:hypothetical protein
MKIAVLDYDDAKGIMELWIKLTELMEPDDGPTLDSSDNNFGKIYIELNALLHKKIFLPTGLD